MSLYCASERSERAPQKDIFSGLKIHLHTMSYTINAVSFNYLWYGAMYTRHTDKTLKLREIYEYASELNFFDIFTI